MNGNRWRSYSNGYPHIFDHARLRYDTADMARHRPISGTQKSATKLEMILSSDCRFPMSTDFGRCRECHFWIGHGRKCGGSRWNSFAICFRSKVISTSGFVADILSFGCGCRPPRHTRAMPGVPTWMIQCHVHAQIHELFTSFTCPE